MSYIDLENKFPDKPGSYNVKIHTGTGSDRITKAYWRTGGFVLLEDRLLDHEYIYAWSKD